MKNFILPVMLVCLSVSAFAKDDRPEINIRIGDERALRECLNENDLLRRDNRMMSDRLRNVRCEQNDNDRRLIDQLSRENQDLQQNNRFLADQVEKLRIDNARLELEINPDIGGRFSLAQSITACSEIRNSVYSQQCAAEAKARSIPAATISQCARISNTFYALECVKNAGIQNTSTRQVQECMGINNSTYAADCVSVAGQRRVRPDVIKSCIGTSSNTFYQLECIKSM